MHFNPNYKYNNMNQAQLYSYMIAVIEQLGIPYIDPCTMEQIGECICEGDTVPPTLAGCAPFFIYQHQNNDEGFVEKTWTTSAIDTTAGVNSQYTTAFSHTDTEGYPSHSVAEDITAIKSTIRTFPDQPTTISDNQSQLDGWIYCPSDGVTLTQAGSSEQSYSIWVSSKNSSKLVERLASVDDNSINNVVMTLDKGWYRVRMYLSDPDFGSFLKLRWDVTGSVEDIGTPYIYQEKPEYDCYKIYECDGELLEVDQITPFALQLTDSHCAVDIECNCPKVTVSTKMKDCTSANGTIVCFGMDSVTFDNYTINIEGDDNPLTGVCDLVTVEAYTLFTLLSSLNNGLDYTVTWEANSQIYTGEVNSLQDLLDFLNNNDSSSQWTYDSSNELFSKADGNFNYGDLRLRLTLDITDPSQVPPLTPINSLASFNQGAAVLSGTGVQTTGNIVELIDENGCVIQQVIIQDNCETVINDETNTELVFPFPVNTGATYIHQATNTAYIWNGSEWIEYPQCCDECDDVGKLYYNCIRKSVYDYTTNDIYVGSYQNAYFLDSTNNNPYGSIIINQINTNTPYANMTPGYHLVTTPSRGECGKPTLKLLHVPENCDCVTFSPEDDGAIYNCDTNTITIIGSAITSITYDGNTYFDGDSLILNEGVYPIIYNVTGGTCTEVEGILDVRCECNVERAYISNITTCDINCERDITITLEVTTTDTIEIITVSGNTLQVVNSFTPVVGTNSFVVTMSCLPGELKISIPKCGVSLSLFREECSL